MGAPCGDGSESGRVLLGWGGHPWSRHSGVCRIARCTSWFGAQRRPGSALGIGMCTRIRGSLRSFLPALRPRLVMESGRTNPRRGYRGAPKLGQRPSARGAPARNEANVVSGRNPRKWLGVRGLVLNVATRSDGHADGTAGRGGLSRTGASAVAIWSTRGGVADNEGWVGMIHGANDLRRAARALQGGRTVANVDDPERQRVADV